jgi:hypothetical protein
MNAYEQAENKLTYNFLCLIEHMPSRNEFLDFLLDRKYSCANEDLLEVGGVSGGNESNPDGKLRIKLSNNDDLCVFLENKTWRCGLDEQQLRNHLNVCCKSSDEVLLVITPRLKDYEIIRKLNNDKIFFRTWTQIADKLRELNLKENSFIVSQFLEYGNTSGEFIQMESLNKRDITTYVEYRKSNIEQKINKAFEVIMDKLDLSEFGLKEIEPSIKDHYGRLGIEFWMDSKKNDYNQWFFFGILYDPTDHQIKFKKTGIPELAFFFDTSPKAKETLRKNQSFKDALKRLCAKGFEENLIKKTANPWRLLYWRKPLSDIEEVSPEELQKVLVHLLNELNQEKQFASVMF